MRCYKHLTPALCSQTRLCCSHETCAQPLAQANLRAANHTSRNQISNRSRTESENKRRRDPPLTCESRHLAVAKQPLHFPVLTNGLPHIRILSQRLDGSLQPRRASELGGHMFNVFGTLSLSLTHTQTHTPTAQQPSFMFCCACTLSRIKSKRPTQLLVLRP